MSFENWTGGLADICSAFQLDLSCLVDGELDEPAAARAMVHLEECESCRGFFEDTRRHARLHRDMADPDRLLAHLATLTGTDLAAEAEGIDLIHRLATIFYQLGKAYTLAAIDPGFCQRIFEDAVPVDVAKDRGRGFVDAVLMDGRGSGGGIDWRQARHLLNGRLELIEEPLEKGRRLLAEAVTVDPSHEEARLYLAFLHAHEGKTLKAAEEYRDIFETAVSETNRGLAIVQLGLLYSTEDHYKRAAACFRWVTCCGLADRDDRFWFARFNLGMVYANWRRPKRSLQYFRELLDRHPGRLQEVAEAFFQSPNLRKSISSQDGFPEALASRCPELFHPEAAGPAGLDS